ncbi:YqaA family protein [Tropicibacter naphthalenivorans]|uniref:Inner membrane protein YqaA n=1 Tax=Tropicibacter naphthalenivorans TaxID=441103 RepID=A0A0N7LZR0_9RHOB|nr:YqaA family protein [Tropicibacter naphthalenivorans]CUH78361.1 Inner membrane protein YqaA [Tropicibacter naphthalenivorans]SMC79932.1 membrane protein YqaA, SNARE-associated domain [Tropicibacter naphthalenivorans]
MGEAAALGGLFLVAFGAATILPFQSEIVFAALQAGGLYSVATLVIVASIGNTLGSVVNYAMGRGAERYKGSRWFPANEEQLARAQRWYSKYGVWTLLLSWAPLGDAITLIAGLMKTPLWLFVALVGFAKTVRYIAFAAITAGFL